MHEHDDLAKILLTEKHPFEHAQRILAETGIVDPVKAEKNIQLLAGRGAGHEIFCRILPHVLRCLREVADPDTALNNWERLVGATRDREFHFDYLEKNPGRIEVLLRIIGTSGYLADILVLRHQLLYEILENNSWQKTIEEETLKAELATLFEHEPDTDPKPDILRLFKQRHMLGIGARDICDKASVEQTLRETTLLAEVCTHTAFEIAEAEMLERFGTPMGIVDGEPTQASAVVIAFGKLGGRELNYSSDIDLMFIYSHDGETQGEGDNDTDRQSVANQQYFSKLAERCIDILSRITDHGHLYRVDMRLRPMGSKGPLTSSLNSHLDYYEFFGESWERQALLKARAVAGDMGLAERFFREIRPFIHPKYLDYKGIRELQDLKRRVERQVERDGLTHSEVKLGFGGIRDIEFTVQFLQLLNGGRQPELQTTNTLDALKILKGMEHISPAEFASLAEAYRFLRKVENRLQIVENRRMHALPSQPEALEVLARGLGYNATDGHPARRAFEQEYSWHTENVRRLFDKFFGKLFAGAERTSPIVDLILNPEPAETEIVRVLSHYGFRDCRSAYRNVCLLAGAATASSHPSRAKDSFCNISPILFQHLEKSPDPDKALNNLQRCIAALGAPSAFYEILSSSPKCIELLVSLSSYSDHLIRLLVNDPGVIDFLLADRMLEEESSYANIDNALTRFLDINPHFYESIQRFKNGELLRISLRDILGLATIAEITRELSWVAEIMLARVYNRFLEEHIIRYGEPFANDGSPSTMAILGMGKIGGREINYASDLDVIFVYAFDGQTKGGTSESVSCKHFFNTLAAQVMKKMSELNPYGYLYKIDARLRPDGEQGLLAISATSFLEYHRRKSAVWEQRAMTKLRPVAGDPGLGEELRVFVQQLIYAPGFFSPNVVKDAVAMLEKIIGAAQNKNHEGREIKNAEGGIVEIEFLVQSLQLKHGSAREELRTTNTIELLDRLADDGIVARRAHDDLSATLVLLRKIENRLRLMHNRPLSELPSDPDALDKLALRLGITGAADRGPGDVLIRTIESYIGRSHRVFEEQIRKLNKT